MKQVKDVLAEMIRDGKIGQSWVLDQSEYIKMREKKAKEYEKQFRSFKKYGRSI